MGYFNFMLVSHLFSFAKFSIFPLVATIISCSTNPVSTSSDKNDNTNSTLPDSSLWKCSKVISDIYTYHYLTDSIKLDTTITRLDSGRCTFYGYSYLKITPNGAITLIIDPTDTSPRYDDSLKGSYHKTDSSYNSTLPIENVFIFFTIHYDTISFSMVPKNYSLLLIPFPYMSFGFNPRDTANPNTFIFVHGTTQVANLSLNNYTQSIQASLKAIGDYNSKEYDIDSIGCSISTFEFARVPLH